MRKYNVLYTDNYISFSLKSGIYTKSSSAVDLKNIMLSEASQSHITASTVKEYKKVASHSKKDCR